MKETLKLLTEQEEKDLDRLLKEFEQKHVIKEFDFMKDIQHKKQEFFSSITKELEGVIDLRLLDPKTFEHDEKKSHNKVFHLVVTNRACHDNLRHAFTSHVLQSKVLTADAKEHIICRFMEVTKNNLRENNFKCYTRDYILSIIVQWMYQVLTHYKYYYEQSVVKRYNEKCGFKYEGSELENKYNVAQVYIDALYNDYILPDSFNDLENYLEHYIEHNMHHEKRDDGLYDGYVNQGGFAMDRLFGASVLGAATDYLDMFPYMTAYVIEDHDKSDNTEELQRIMEEIVKDYLGKDRIQVFYVPNVRYVTPKQQERNKHD
jgi:hypothetical protein